MLPISFKRKPYIQLQRLKNNNLLDNIENILRLSKLLENLLGMYKK